MLFSTKHQIKVFLNPDLIAQGISKIDFNEASFQAGRHIISEVRVFHNFWTLYRPLADNWFVFDNSGSLPELVISMDAFDQLSGTKKNQIADSFLKGKYGFKKK